MWSRPHRASLRSVGDAAPVGEFGGLSNWLDRTGDAGDLFRHDRIIVVAFLLGVILISWIYLLTGAGMDMPAMGGMLMEMASPDLDAWLLRADAGDVGGHDGSDDATQRRADAPPLRQDRAQTCPNPAARLGPPASSVLGYLVVWAAFSVAAVILQYGLDQAKLLSPMLHMTSAGLAGALLILAGVYQWTPLKQACLRRCRSPLGIHHDGVARRTAAARS